MNFIENLKEVLGVDEVLDANQVKFTVLLDKGGYFENVKGVVSYSDTEIVLKTKPCRIVIKGENLFIKKYCEGDISICGKITSIERE